MGSVKGAAPVTQLPFESGLSQRYSRLLLLAFVIGGALAGVFVVTGSNSTGQNQSQMLSQIFFAGLFGYLFAVIIIERVLRAVKSIPEEFRSVRQTV